MQLRRRTMLKLPLLAAAAPETLKRGLQAAGQTLIPRSDQPSLLRFGVIGDPGSGAPPQMRVARQLEGWHKRNPLEFILTTGDNVYENGESEYFDRKFIEPYETLLEQGVEFRASLGNHDLRWKGGAEQLKEPTFGYIDGQDEYDFAAGPTLADGKQLARFICLNSTRWVDAVRENDRKQLDYLRDRLREKIRESDKYRWNVVYFHHAVYSYTKGGLFHMLNGHGSTEELQTVLEPEIRETADLVLNGHDHFYQKIKPQNGVHYLITGAAGKRRSGVDKKHKQVEKGSLDYHFMDMSLSEEALYFQAINDSGELVHGGEIVKRRS